MDILTLNARLADDLVAHINRPAEDQYDTSNVIFLRSNNSGRYDTFRMHPRFDHPRLDIVRCALSAWKLQTTELDYWMVKHLRPACYTEVYRSSDSCFTSNIATNTVLQKLEKYLSRANEHSSIE